MMMMMMMMMMKLKISGQEDGDNNDHAKETHQKFNSFMDQLNNPLPSFRELPNPWIQTRRGTCGIHRKTSNFRNMWNFWGGAI